MDTEDWGNIPLAAVFGALVGYAGVVAIQGLGVNVSHVAGTLSDIGVNILEIKTTLFIVVMGIWVSYVVGAAAGTYIGTRMGPGAPLLFNGITLISLGVFVPQTLLDNSSVIAGLLGFFAAFAMGMQNTTASGASMGKTTHLTRVSAELGLAIAGKDREKLYRMSCIIGGFAGGVLVALFTNYWLGIKGLVIPGVVSILTVAWHADRKFFLTLPRARKSENV